MQQERLEIRHPYGVAILVPPAMSQKSSVMLHSRPLGGVFSDTIEYKFRHSLRPILLGRRSGQVSVYYN